ncbi:MAG: LacI family DNA-binding transcriptional regulator [Verrucomicrobia bacterium]|nr:LacI family DNA-binding transcriptional regulator [Verrucomicrobiota bacterium]
MNVERRTLSRITSRDIASAAGVSRTTVSFVLNGKEAAGISAETRARVLEAASALGYVPNSAARMLVSGRSRTLGLVLAHGDLMTFDAYAPPLMFGISRVCNARGYKLLVEAVKGRGRRNAYVDLVKSKSIDALIVLNSSAADNDLVALIESGFPVVLIGSIGHPGENAVRSHAVRAAERATQHLLDLGHRRIAHIAYAPMRYAGSMERYQAFERALQKRKLKPDPDLIADGDFSMESGYYAMREILGRNRRFTALFAGNDTIAIGAMAALREAGLSIPKDVAIVGFDDLPIASYCQPALTTVNTNPVIHGEQAALAAFALLEGHPVGVRTCGFPLKLVVRESCGQGRKRPPRIDI